MKITYKEKLRELFKTIPEIKKDLEEGEILYRCNRIWEAWDYGTMTEDDFDEVIITLEERHLRMYCEKNSKKDIVFFLDELCEIIPQKETGFHFSTICKLDNTKSFDNQNEEVYEAIFNFLKD